MPLSAAERALRSSTAAHERWAREPDRRAATAAARNAGPGSLDYWLPRVDERIVGSQERRAAAENLRQAHFRRLALKSSRARRRDREAAEIARAAGLVTDEGDAA